MFVSFKMPKWFVLACFLLCSGVPKISKTTGIVAAVHLYGVYTVYMHVGNKHIVYACSGNSLSSYSNHSCNAVYTQAIHIQINVVV